MHHLLTVILVTLLLGLTGCGPKELVRERYVYVVKHDVPSNPSFVVLPQDQYTSETDFAERIEAVLLGAGHRVVNRPARKLIETERSAVAGNADNNGAMSGSERSAAQARVTETYYALEDVDADYIVFTRARVAQMTMTEREAQTNTTSPAGPQYRDEIYDIARIRIVHRQTGDVVANFELTLDSQASERLREALSRVVTTSI